MRQAGEQRNPERERYAAGMELYKQRKWQEAAQMLGPLRDKPGAAGRMARFYEGMSFRAMGGEALGQGQYDLAAACFRAAMAAMGRETSLGTCLAGVYAKAGRPEACARQMEGVVEKDGPKVVSVRKLALAQWQAGRRVEAYMTLSRGIRTFGESADLHLQEGMFLAAEERYEEARERFCAAVRADGRRADARRLLALTHAASGRVREAVEEFQRAFELAPGDLMLGVQLAMSAKAAGEAGIKVRIALPGGLAAEDTQDLPALARSVLEQDDLVDALLALPNGPMDDQMYTTLLRAIRAAIEIRPEFADLRLKASRVCERLGLAEEAVSEARLAAQINPRYAAALVQLGRLEAARGRRGEGIRRLRQAIRCGADWADVHCQAGELLAQAGRVAGARRHLKRALDLNRNYPRAQAALAALAA